MIFQQLIIESILQVNDPTRFDARQTFASPDAGAITKIEISPDNGANYYDVTNSDPDNWFLDWSYDSVGEKTVKVRIESENDPVSEKDFTIEVITADEDCLFSSDADLFKFEPEIYCFLKRGRKSFLDVHRLLK